MSAGVSHKLLASFLVCVYLLLGAGGAQAFILCLEDDGAVHLEFNAAGRCAPDCGEGDGNPVPSTTAPGPTQLGEIDTDCQDVSQGSEQTRFRFATPLKDQLPLPLPVALFQGDEFHPRTFSVRLHQAPQPPPDQSLIALRTVVLLN